MPTDTLIFVIHSLQVMLCFFCANLLLLRRRDESVYIPLALFFVFQGVSYLPDLVATMVSGEDVEPVWNVHLNILLHPLDTASPFLFWLYVRALTTEGVAETVPHKALHATPVILTGLCIAPLMTVPGDILSGNASAPDALLPTLHVMSRLLLVADLLFMTMIATYIVLIIRRLAIYRRRLLDVFASTQGRELRWIWLLAIVAGGNLLLSVVDTLFDDFDLNATLADAPVFLLLDQCVVFLLFWVIGVWGLRQRPGLSRSPVVQPNDLPDKQPEKYKHSALEDDRARRIATKINSAMQDDLMYRDPNLSLWDLAKHISVTSHYVSQTLNSCLKRSFFDYVNHWRIKDAIRQLETTDETILMIAYDVGFNSRSSFYKAFKRETGKRPSEIRAEA